ncbi:hypothetical protein O3G_MSEX013025 [Manduca sexta]|uniref:Uncharacterized protein n=1 Tax=Manduca sexta TaxID=7130 RepID=A0A921ZQ50_MANSE|nr:hypothetical protein O3G_MSEX013025 [Manduca sexta]
MLATLTSLENKQECATNFTYKIKPVTFGATFRPKLRKLKQTMWKIVKSAQMSGNTDDPLAALRTTQRRAASPVTDHHTHCPIWTSNIPIEEFVFFEEFEFPRIDLIYNTKL